MAIDWEAHEKIAQKKTRQQYESAVADTKKRQQAAISARQPGFLMGNSGITSQSTQNRLNGFTQSVLAQVQNEQKRKALISAITSHKNQTITPISMAKTAANVASGTAVNAFQNQPESGVERVADTVSGAVKTGIASIGNAHSLATNIMTKPTTALLDAVTHHKYNVGGAVSSISDQLNAPVNRLMESGETDTATAKRGLGKAGQIGVDLGTAATQLALTAGLGAAAGGGARAIQAVQQAGQGAYEAKKADASDGKQALYGVLQGATAYATEGISNVGALGKIFGNGVVDSKIEQASAKAISKFISSDAGRAVANRLATGAEAGLGEAFEQNIQDALTPIYQKITYDPDAKWNAEEMIYNGLVAGALGGIVGSAGKNNLYTAEKNYDAQPVLKEFMERHAAQDTFANEATEARSAAPKAEPIDTSAKNAPENVNTFSRTQENAEPTVAEQAPANVNIPLSVSDPTITGSANAKVKSVPENDVVPEILPEPSNKVVLETQKKKTDMADWIAKGYTRIVDTQSPIVDHFAKDAKDNSGILASNARNAGGTVNYILKEKLADREGNTIGGSLADVVGDIPTGKEQAFWDYMSQRHNIDRAREGKNVIDNYNSSMSKKAVSEIEAANPEFKDIGDDIVNWLDQFTQEWGVNSGLVSPDLYNSLREKYKSYFPTQREFDELESVLPSEVKQQFVDNKSPIKTATGSARDINNPVENIMNYVNRTVKAARYNAVGQEILNSVRANPDGLAKYAEIVDESQSKANNVVSVIENGEKSYLKINDKPLLDALKGLPKATNSIPILSNFVQGYKNLITQKNPFFAVRNIARDVPTAYLYGSETNPIKFFGNMGGAYKDIAKNSENYQRYKAVGGGMSNFFNTQNVENEASNLTKSPGILGKITGKFEDFNNATETAPRLSEFNKVFEQTGDVQKALDSANSITVNFARGGDITKSLDKNGVAYLNAGVQGVDKLVRSMSTPRQAALTLAKGGVMITAPAILTYLRNKDDEDYKNLSNYTKDNYFLIPYGEGHKDGVDGNGKFIKIPKSRELGMIFAALPERIIRAASGEDEAFKGYGTSLATSLAPTNPLENNIFSPIVTNLPSNKNFAGSPIVPESMKRDGRSKYLQYDEKTSELTKAIAEYAHKAGVDLSPKQMDYLLDAYTGVIADFLLPATTKGGSVGNMVKQQFTADPTYSNQSVTDFYDHYDKAMSKAADKNITDTTAKGKTTTEELLKSAMSKASSQMSELSRISLRAGIGTMTEDDTSTLAGYGIDSSGMSKSELQTVLRQKRIEIAEQANKVYKSSSADRDILNIFRLSDVGSFKYGDTQYNLTSSEHSKFQSEIDSLPYQALTAAKKNGLYNQLSEDERDDLVSDIVNFSEDTAKRDIVTSRGEDYKSKNYEAVYQAYRSGIGLADYYAYKKQLKATDPDGGNSTQWQETKAINQTDITNQMKGQLWQIQNKNTDAEKNPYTGTLSQMGVSPETIVAFMQKKAELDDEPNEAFGQTTVSKANKGRAYQLWQYAKSLDLSPAQRNALYDMYQEWGFIPSLSLETIGKKGY